MIILIPDGMNLAEFEEEMTQQMFQKYFDVNFKPDEDENLLFKENIVNLTMPLFEETHVNHHLDKSLLQVMFSQLSHSESFLRLTQGGLTKKKLSVSQPKTVTGTKKVL